MENNYFKEFDNGSLMTDKEVFTKILTHPREALKYIHKNKFENYLTIFMFTLVIFSSLERMISKNDNWKGENIILYLFIAIVFGGLFGWISFYLMGWLSSVTGNWLNGKGNTSDFVRIYVYSSLPKLISFLILLLQLIANKYYVNNYIGDKMFMNIYMIIAYGLAAMQLLIIVWIIVLNVIGIAVVQNFSYGKAFMNYIASIALVVIPIVLIILFFILIK